MNEGKMVASMDGAEKSMDFKAEDTTVAADSTNDLGLIEVGSTDVTSKAADVDGSNARIDNGSVEQAASINDNTEELAVEPEQSLRQIEGAANGDVLSAVDGINSIDGEEPQLETEAMADEDDASDIATTHLDFDVVAREAQAELKNDEGSSPNQELDRLRKLVFASRGSKAQLPEGWEDEAQEVEKTDDTADVSSEIAPGAAQSQRNGDEKMIDRAVTRIGEAISDSEDDSDDDESSSDESSSSSSSSESDTNAPANRRPKAPIVAYGSDDDEDEEGGGKGASGRGPTTKNEVIEPTVDAPPYSVVPSDKEIRPLGKVHSIIDSVVVVSQDTGKAPGAESSPYVHYNSAPIDSQGRRGEQAGEYSVLDTGSLLTFEDRNVLGVVYETFGSVLEPLYALRFAGAEQINRQMIYVGKAVFYVPADSTYVLTRALRAMAKGSDASNVWDEEVGDDERDFSDDEAEAEHKRNVKAAKRHDGASQAASSAASTAPSMTSRGGKRKAHGTRPWQGHQTHAASQQPVHAYNAPVGASLMHPDIDLGISRSAPLPYDDEASTTTTAASSVRYAPYQHVRSRGAGSAGYVGQARGHDARQPAFGHATPAVNPLFAQQTAYTQQPSYPSYQQTPQQHNGYNAAPAWNHYQAAAVNHGMYGAASQQGAYQYPNYVQGASTTSAQASQAYVYPQNDKAEDQTSYDPSQPRY